MIRGRPLYNHTNLKLVRVKAARFAGAYEIFTVVELESYQVTDFHFVLSSHT
jgi:hypothetical protein